MQLTHRTSLRAILGMLCLANAAAAQGLYEGSFASGRIAVELHQSGDQLTGIVTTNGTACPLTGSVNNDRATAEFDLSGQKIPLEAGMDGTVLVVTSGGATHRLVRQVADGNPLADSTLSASPSSPAADPGQSPSLIFVTGGPMAPQSLYAAFAGPWPAGLDLATPQGGAQLSALIAQLMPGVAPQGNPEPVGTGTTRGVRLSLTGPALTGPLSTAHAVAQAQGSTLSLALTLGNDAGPQPDAPGLQQLLATLADLARTKLDAAPRDPAGAAPEVHETPQPPPAAPISEPPAAAPTSAPDTTAAAPPAPAPTPVSPSAPSPIGAAPSPGPPPPTPFAPPAKAAPTGPIPGKLPLIPRLPESPSQDAPSTPATASSKAPALRPIPSLNPAHPPAAIPDRIALDPALVGTWRTSEAHVSGAATLAIETVYKFNADGTFALGSRSAGGDARTTLESGFKVSSTGTWTASSGVLKTTNQSGEKTQVNYLFHKGQLVFKRGPGKYTFWSR